MADSSSGPRPTAPVGGKASSGTNVINQKFGPFPLWVYLLAIGVGIYAYEKNRKSSTSKGAATTPKGGTGGGTSGTQGSGAATQSAVEQTLQANVGSATSNPQWEANVESVLVGYGYPTVQVQSALNTYLAGGVLSSIQQEIVNAAIAAVGAPPSAPTAPTASTASPTVANAGTAAPASPSLATAYVPSGSGFNSGGGTADTPTAGANGADYVPVSATQLQGYTGPTYYEISPGNFQEVPQTSFGKLAPGTTIYIPSS